LVTLYGNSLFLVLLRPPIFPTISVATTTENVSQLIITKKSYVEKHKKGELQNYKVCPRLIIEESTVITRKNSHNKSIETEITSIKKTKVRSIIVPSHPPSMRTFMVSAVISKDLDDRKGKSKNVFRAYGYKIQSGNMNFNSEILSRYSSYRGEADHFRYMEENTLNKSVPYEYHCREHYTYFHEKMLKGDSSTANNSVISPDPNIFVPHVNPRLAMKSPLRKSRFSQISLAESKIDIDNDKSDTVSVSLVLDNSHNKS